MANANLIQYSQVKVYADGNMLMEEATVTMKRESGAQPVKTVGKGFAGVSKGAPVTNVTVESFVPTAGMEFDPTANINLNQITQLTLVLGTGQQATMNGFILTDDLSHSVDAAGKLSFSFITGPVVWEAV